MNFHSRQIPVQYLKLGHNFFSLHPFQVIKVISTFYNLRYQQLCSINHKYT